MLKMIWEWCSVFQENTKISNFVFILISNYRANNIVCTYLGAVRHILCLPKTCTSTILDKFWTTMQMHSPHR